MHQVTYVIPCFNEAARLSSAAVAELLTPKWVRLLFVDDGSTDGIFALLEKLCAAHPRAQALKLERNVGKAEAVRAGLRQAAEKTSWVGYADADFATPPAELIRLAELTRGQTYDVVLGSRVALAGYQVERKPMRHYLGRVFGTAASLLLGARIYDTQCGAKLFRVTPGLSVALEAPFTTRWIFDVELLGRLLREEPRPRLREDPLQQWRDVAGSKLRASAMARAPLDLLRVGLAHRRKR